MRKIILWPISFLFLLIIVILIYLSTFGYKTEKFNSLLENKIMSSVPSTDINLNKIKIKINIKNLSFFVKIFQPNIKYHGNQIDINEINAYINLKSLLVGKPKIDKIYIVSNELDLRKIKSVIKYQKPSNFKKFFLNDVNDGKMTFKLDLDLKDNEIKNYEINGIVKNFFANVQNIDLKKTSFIYSIKKNIGQIDNIRGVINGFQISSGNVEFNNSKILKLKGSIESDLKLSKNDINKIVKNEILQELQNFKLNGKIQSEFKVNFDKTLKVNDYRIEAFGNIQKSSFVFKEPQSYLFLKNQINSLILEKTEFKINYNKEDKKLINLSGLYKIDDSTLQKFNFNNLFDSKAYELSLSGNLDSEINIPLLNFNSKNKIVSLNTEVDVKKGSINLKKFNLKEGKSNIKINNLSLKKNKLIKFDNILVKTFLNEKPNNDFKISLGKTVKMTGLKYDASNLTKFFEKNNNSNFLNSISKDITVNIKEISTNAYENIFNFNLIGNIDKGKFNKIVSKGEFKGGKYLDISLKSNKSSNKKILEIYSDFSKPLLSNYKFFDGLSGGQVLMLSSFDSKKSNINLTVENFKVKDAPGLVKLLSLADFGGMVDAMSGEGLSFEKLEMSLEKNEQVLNLKELYAIGPSISILMEGYVESKSGLVSLRGTMVPAKTLNKFLSKLPIVGDILIPKEIGEGLFGISFKMKGLPGNIKTSVNPIKTLTPRFIQKALKKT